MERVICEGKCARCCAVAHPFAGADAGATSRPSMDSDLPGITVCATCREREAFRGSAGMPMIRFEHWPVELADLLAEDELRLRYYRSKPASEALKVSRRRSGAKITH